MNEQCRSAQDQNASYLKQLSTQTERLIQAEQTIRELRQSAAVDRLSAAQEKQRNLDRNHSQFLQNYNHVLYIS